VKVLLWVDLEGVAGVESIADLIEGEAGFVRAQELLAGEIAAACAGLQQPGAVTGTPAPLTVCVADSHQGGASPTVSRLPPGVQRVPANPAALDGVDVVACLGMHAADAGFVPHTMDLCCIWEADGRAVSEAELVLGLAAERGVRVLFVAGDEALALKSVPFLATRARPVAEAHAALRRAAAGAPVPAPALRGELSIRFRSRWMADVAERGGGVRAGETVVRLGPGPLEERIARGNRLLEPVSETFATALRPWALVEDVTAFAARPFVRTTPHRQDEARRALASFLSQALNGEKEAALRALTLHMLEGHAPAFFAAQQLSPVLEDAVARLQLRPFDAPEDMPLMMARLDAVYVLRERGRAAAVDEAQLERCIAQVLERDVIWGWLMGELAAQLGLPGRVTLPAARPYRRTHRVADLYWLTHLFLLETRYLRRTLPRTGFESMTEELLLAAPWAVAQGALDLAAEIAFCLALTGEDRSLVLDALAKAQGPDGAVGDAHCTAAALLAFATAA
jgi:D-amino peptidase